MTHRILITIMLSSPTHTHTLYTASSAVASKYDELDILYASVAKVISDGLSLSEKASTLGLSQLQCTLMVLKAPCNNDPCYIDRWGCSVVYTL